MHSYVCCDACQCQRPWHLTWFYQVLNKYLWVYHRSIRVPFKSAGPGPSINQSINQFLYWWHRQTQWQCTELHRKCKLINNKKLNVNISVANFETDRRPWLYVSEFHLHCLKVPQMGGSPMQWTLVCLKSSSCDGPGCWLLVCKNQKNSFISGLCKHSRVSVIAFYCFQMCFSVS